jgi:hypothetical protein
MFWRALRPEDGVAGAECDEGLVTSKEGGDENMKVERSLEHPAFKEDSKRVSPATLAEPSRVADRSL